MKFTNERVHAETKHPNGTTATRTIRYEFNDRTYETIRFYSTSGVYYNFFDRPAKTKNESPKQ